MANCDNCGSHVSPAWARVVSVNGEIKKCLNCADSKAAAFKVSRDE